MPKISDAHRKLISQLARQHASNAIVKRQVRRGVTGVKKAYNKAAKSGAITRDMGRAGSMVYGQNGKQIGTALGRAITGHGDYKLHNTREQGQMSNRRRNHDLEKGEMEISHSEYIGELVSSAAAVAAFTSQSYGINAGNSGTFPFLSAIANNFQNYEFTKLVFEFRSLTSDTAGSTYVVPMGSVILGTQYDSLLGPFPNKPTMENSDFAVSCKPSEHAMMAVECKSNLNPLGRYYVSSGLSLTVGINNQDIRFQNMGIFQIASIGMPTNSAALDLGEIWVHYTCRLYKPTILGNLNAIQSAHYKLGDPSANYPFGTNTAPVASSANFMALTFNAATNVNTFYFPIAITEGSFLIVWDGIAGTGFSAFAPHAFDSPNGTCTFSSIWDLDILTYIYAPSTIASGNSTTVMQACICTVNAPGATLGQVRLTSLTLTGTGSGGDLMVTPWNLSVTN